MRFGNTLWTATRVKYSADLLSRMERFWYPRGSAQQTDLLVFHVDDGGQPGIFGAGAVHPVTETARSTNFTRSSAANHSGARTGNP